ncbi:Tfp pilus assembly protein FimT/FimU [Nostoc sp. FACHB-110]|uniref:pilus assembly FimT family protein n=1 Tax=Nostoc sp. FACHB-110 TaxID=2692834 RepID=UPI00168339EF|nr:prepilin-type N-terminal cleavage/methylation domain-containing protein [Nostoc sp. FACHB-110]MBD2439446.1 prepilin-type N-terminal cleavage/methylation domain-containing protein [Nostoc sp. FACHB-110]
MNKYLVRFLLFSSNTRNFCKHSSSSGFTLIEILVVVVAVGILAGLALPHWQTFVVTRHLNDAQAKIYWAMRQAQSQAVKEKITSQVSLREKNGVVQWTVHAADANQFIPDGVKNNDQLWRNLHSNIQIDQELNNKGKNETTFPKQSSQQEWRILFNYQGCPVYKVQDDCTKTSLRTLGQITFSSPKSGKVKRCVYVSTMLGAMRMGKENSKANTNGKYCY